jgi:hypothetical protein
MKNRTVLILILVLVMTAIGSAWAKDKKPESKAKSPVSVQAGAGKTPEELGRRSREIGDETAVDLRRERDGMARGLMHAEQLRKLDEQIEDKRGRHNKFTGELKAIKELALEEKAEKTAGRIQDLIDKSTGQFDEEVRKLEENRDRIRELAEKQGQERSKRRERLMLKKEMQEKAKVQGKAGKGQGKSKAGAKDQGED